MTKARTFSGFIGETFGLLGRNAVPVLVFIAVLGGLNSLGSVLGYLREGDSLAELGLGFSIDPADGLAAGLFRMAAGVLSIIGSYFLLATMLVGEDRMVVRDTCIWAYVGMTILSTLGIICGFVLLVVPGLILLVRWSASSGYLIDRKLGVIESISASWDATRGSSWPIFFVGLVLFIGLAVVGMVIGAASDAIDSPIVIAAVSSFADVAGNAVFLAFGIAVFLVVADDSDAISEVFE